MFTSSGLWKHFSTSASMSRSLKFQYMTVATLLAFVLSAMVPVPTWHRIIKSISTAHNTLTWSVPPPERVSIHIIPASVHFDMGTPAWEKLLPSGGHIVHLDQPDGSVSTHTVAMFHQLKCIEILHRAYYDEGSHRTSELPQHCLNYLRQTFECHMDMRLEPQGSTFTRNGFESLCYDWDGIFEEAERNHRVFSSRLGV